MTMDFYAQKIQDYGWDQRFRYQLLDRMRLDCEYYLGPGRRLVKYLWAGSAEEQIGFMKALWNSFPPDGKPEWLSYERILEYEKQMLEPPCPHESSLAQGGDA